MTLRDLIRTCGELAPERLAEEWDNVGLQAGNPEAEIARVLLCLEVTPAVLREAEELGAHCLIAHHPLIFRPIRSLREDRPEGRILAGLARAGTALYVMHTNLDAANPGTSDALASLLGVEDAGPLAPAPAPERRFKLVAFTPRPDAERVRNALGDAGAGAIGDYSHCSFSSPGTGSFVPLQGAHPAVGAVGIREHVDEERIEVAVPAGILPRVVAAMLAAHPYEEVAYDLYPLEPMPSNAGIGRIGRLDRPCSLRELAARARERLGAPRIAVVGDPDRPIARTALCGGAGADLIDTAAAAGADVLVTGDVKHHQALHALDVGLAVLDAGHYHTERPVLDLLAARLREALPSELEIRVSGVDTSPLRDL